MKKIKRIVSLMVAAIMVIATIAPALAGTYDVASLGPAGTTFEVFRVYHWVVRGDTLENIAQRWGTTPAYIRSFNTEYFADLAARNVTYGTNIQLEPGVRLHIYDMLRARRYVRRGDTLESLAAIPVPAWGPEAPYTGTFIMNTTPAAVRRENTIEESRGWFNDLYTINRTLSTTMPLVESDAIGAVYDVFYADKLATRPVGNHIGIVTSLPWWPRRLISNDPLGTPIYVTIPVRAYAQVTGAQALPLRDVVYYRNPVEQLPWVGGELQWNNTFNQPPTNPGLVNQFVGVYQHPVRGHYHFHFVPLNIPGLFR